MTTATNTPPIGGDDFDLDRPIWGAKAIAPEIGKNKQQTFRLLEAGLIPATKINKQWVTTRRRLRRFFDGASSSVAAE
jgi:hypothetical protein